MQTNNQNSNSSINPKLGSSVTNAIKNAEAGEMPALDDISNITNRVVEKIKASENILIALSKNPNIDEISAALGLAMILDTIHKHVTAIFSGQVPNVLQFLKPEETFEKTTNSLQDFIIALSKDKVDHISYKIEGDFVKVYVTPYKATIGQSDLSMSHGDYNVDLVICFNVISGDEIDPALSEYGRIMHDATAINLTVDTPGRFAELEWQDSNVSSISEMIVGLADKLGLASFSEQVATALLTGIVASTDHFSNPRTSSNTMSIASKLMSFGANQQLISSQIMEKIKTPTEAQVPAAPVATGPQVAEAPIASNPPSAKSQVAEAPVAPNPSVAPVAPSVPTTSVAPVISSTPAELATPTAPAPVMSTPLSENTLDYIEIEPNPNQSLDGQPLESQPTQVPQSPEPQISPAPQPQEPQSVSQLASAPQSFESQPVSAPQVIEPQSAPTYQAPINPAAAAASAVMENNFIQNPEPNLPQPNYTNETPNYQAPAMPTPPLNFAQNLATPQSVSAPFTTPSALDVPAPSPLDASTSLTSQAPSVASVSQEQPVQYLAPIQPIQSAQPIQAVQPTQPIQPMQYSESSAPIQPMQFTPPVTQAQPMPYMEPMQPAQFTQPVPPVPPAPVIFNAAAMPNQSLASDQNFTNPNPADLTQSMPPMPLMPPMPPEAPSTPDVDFFAQAAAATEAAQANQAPSNPVASGPIPADLAPVSTPAPAPLENPAPLETPAPLEASAEPPLRTFASESPLISQPINTSVPASAPIAEPTAIFSPEEPIEPASAKIDPTAFHIPGM